MAKKYLDYNGLLYFWQKLKTTFALISHTHTKSQITDFPTTMTPSSHAHGNIQNGGTLQTTDVTIANGDKLVITDSSDSNKVARASVAFDGSTTTKALTQKGTFESFNNYSHPTYTAKTAAAVKVGNDGTGHVVIGAALTKSDVGLGSVDNTADANKSVKSAGKLTAAASIDGVNFDGSAGIAHFGTIGSASDNVYPVTLAGFTLVSGAKFAIKIGSSNLALTSSNTLNVNGTGGKKVYYSNSQSITLKANHVYEFVYDGTQYQLIGDLDTNSTYANYSLGQGYGTCTTAEATAAKAVTLANYALSAGGIVSVKFTYAVPASATMNINSKGAKNIFFKGAAITAGIIKAGDTATFIYDGTQYHLLAIDRWDTDIKNKVDQVSGKGLSTNDFTDTLKSKLDGIASGAEVNQNAFSNVKVGSTTVAADGKTDTLELVAGSNVTLTPDATNDKVTIAATNTTYSDFAGTAHGLVPASTAADTDSVLLSNGSWKNVTVYEGHDMTKAGYAYYDSTIDSLVISINQAGNNGSSFGTSGLMSGADKTKLDKLAFDSSNKIDSSILPSYVDDVIEVYARSGQTALSSTWLATGSASGTVVTPETGKIYVLMADSGDYTADTQFRWSGTTYVKMADGGVSAITNEEIDAIMAA